MQLIRHAIEHLRGNSYFDATVHRDEQTREAINHILTATPSYRRRDRLIIIRRNLRTCAHPYFLHYEPLRKLCLSILRNERILYGASQEKLHGILFDGSWLWEEYLAQLLSTFKHPQNKERTGAIALFKNSPKTYYPDFHNPHCVLDAKYKNKTRLSDNREDLFQLITYLHVLNVKKGGFITPSNHPTTKDSRELEGMGGHLRLFQLRIPQGVPTFRDFIKAIKQSEDDLKRSIKDFYNLYERE